MKQTFTSSNNFSLNRLEKSHFQAKKFSHFFKTAVLLLMLACSPAIFAQNEFITEWTTTNPGVSPKNAILIPAQGSFSYTWNRVNGPGSGSGTGNGNTTITFPTAGNYRVKMTATGASPFNAIKFKNDEGDSKKITKLTQWGDIAWSTMESAFAGTKNLVITATDVPNLQLVTNMNEMFSDSNITNVPNINSWDVSKVTTMHKTFYFAHINSDISGWDVGKVTDMSTMFYGASNFNQNIGAWDVKNVQNFYGMFYGAYDFDQDLGSWNISSASDASNMFGANMSCENYSKTLAGWAANDAHTPTNLDFSAVQIDYSPDVIAARDHLINVRNWNITGDFLGFCQLSTVNAEQKRVKTFPNPAKDFLTINGLDGKETLSLYDMNGRLLQSSKANGKEMKLNLSNYAKGIYLLTITSDKGTATRKISKQ